MIHALSIGLLVCCVSLAAQFVVNDSGQAAEPSAELEQARAQFIKNFKRIGLNTTPGDAAFLRLMVELRQAKRGVEVGTATGYGAMLMGLGFERTGGELITIEIDPKMAAAARKNFQAMQLEKTVKLIEGDALKVLPQLEGEFDFVFLDAVKSDYLKYLRAIEPKLKPGALIIADNAIRSAKDMQDFLDAVQNDPKYRTVIIRASDEKNDGMAVTLKIQ